MKVINIFAQLLLIITYFCILKSVLIFDPSSLKTASLSLTRLVIEILFCAMLLNYIYYKNKNSIKMFKKTQSIVDTLMAKSNKALDIFNKTKEDLLKVNTEIVSELEANESKINALEVEKAKIISESAALRDLKLDNNNLIFKINEFLK